MLNNHYIFIGPQKTGTSWIDMILRTSSDIVLPENTKETFFFDRYYRKGLNFYNSLYSNASISSITVEVAPSYAGDEDALKRLSDCLPNANIILTVREPVSRSISHYYHMTRYGYLKGDILAAISQDSRIIHDSKYYKILESLHKYFPKEQIHLLSYEDLKNSPKEFVSRLSSLLGAEINAEESIIHRKSNTKKVTRNAFIAKAASFVADKFKEAGLYSIPRLARKYGLRNLIERSPTNNDPNISEEHIKKIREMIDFDYQEFKKSHGLRFEDY